MTSFHRFLPPFALGVVLAGCDLFTGPGIEGRWAATGIELVAEPGTAELRLACAAPARLTHGLVPDSAGTIRFSTAVQFHIGIAPHLYRVDFLGHLGADTLFATVTRRFGVGAPVVQTHTMLRDGDAGWDRIGCAQ
jgi:hypothetical protein